MISPILDGMTIEEAIAKKQLYIVDLEILHEIACKGENKASSYTQFDEIFWLIFVFLIVVFNL